MGYGDITAISNGEVKFKPTISNGDCVSKARDLSIGAAITKYRRDAFVLGDKRTENGVNNNEIMAIKDGSITIILCPVTGDDFTNMKRKREKALCVLVYVGRCMALCYSNDLNQLTPLVG